MLLLRWREKKKLISDHLNGVCSWATSFRDGETKWNCKCLQRNVTINFCVTDKQLLHAPLELCWKCGYYHMFPWLDALERELMYDCVVRAGFFYIYCEELRFIQYLHTHFSKVLLRCSSPNGTIRHWNVKKGHKCQIFWSEICVCWGFFLFLYLGGQGYTVGFEFLFFCFLFSRVLDCFLPNDCLPRPRAKQPSKWDRLHPRCKFPKMKVLWQTDVQSQQSSICLLLQILTLMWIQIE